MTESNGDDVQPRNPAEFEVLRPEPGRARCKVRPTPGPDGEIRTRHRAAEGLLAVAEQPQAVGVDHVMVSRLSATIPR